VASAYLQALLLTGAGREDLAALEWANVDFKWRSLTIRDRVEGERTIPLTPHVAKLLQGLKGRSGHQPHREAPAAQGEMTPRACAIIPPCPTTNHPRLKQ
jgi:integrase